MLNCLRSVFKKLLHQKTFKEDLLLASGIPENTLSLLLTHPFNNIIHNCVLKLFIVALESQNEAVFRSFFSENAVLRQILELINSQRQKLQSDAKNSQRIGFLGHVKQLISHANNSEFASQMKQCPVFEEFMREYYAAEQVMEETCLGDVNVRPIDFELERSFYFVVEEAQTKYAAFLEAQTQKQGGENEGSEREALEVEMH